MPPCIRSWRATRGPTASISTGMAMPASRPLRTEVRPKRAEDDGDGEVAGQHQADAAAHRRAMDARDRRLGEIVDRLHRAHHGVGADLAGDGVELGPGQHPVEVAAGREGTCPRRPATMHPHRVVGGEGLDGVDGWRARCRRRSEFICSPRLRRRRRHAVCRRAVWTVGSCPDHIRKTPNFVGPIGWFIAADRPSASAMRVSTGSRMPSSHSRAVA